MCFFFLSCLLWLLLAEVSALSSHTLASHIYVHTSFRSDFFFQCYLTSTENIVRTVRDGEPRTATSTSTQLLSSECLNYFFKCCFTFTETVRTIRDGREPRTATSTFTQLLSSECLNSCFCFCFSSVALRAQRPYQGLLGTGSPGRSPGL